MDSISAQAQAQVQARYDALTTSAKAEILAKTGVDVNDARVQKGAVATASLLQNGYNPSSDADSAKLVHSISGGLCLFVPIGPVLAGYLELIWQIGNAVSCPLENAFSSMGLGSPSPACGGKPCNSSGNWTAAGIIGDGSSYPSGWNQTGSFTSLVIPMLATAAAQGMNCKGGTPTDMIVDACVVMWNRVHEGPSIQIWVPPLGVDPGVGGVSPILIAGTGEQVSGSAPSAKAGQDPNIYYAFQPVSVIKSSGQDGSSSFSLALDASKGSDVWTPFGIPNAPPGLSWTYPRIVTINAGALIDPSTGKVAKSTTVVGHAGAILGGGFVGGLLLSVATGRSANSVFDGAWGILQTWAKDALGAVEGGIKVSTGAAEGLSRKKRRRR